jgi:hypothetical protein
MYKNADRLYELLPAAYRQKDAEKGYPLRALLRVISEQVNLIEENIDQLYENWFVETCQDWAVAYVGDLVGYRPVHEAGEPGEIATPQGRLCNKILIPRREVAKTVRYRRRKGTLALLELLANDVAGWPARAVQFYTHLSFCQSLKHINLGRGRTANLRLMDALDRLDGPFDEMAHTVDIRRISSHRRQGGYNIPSIGVFIWPIKSLSVTHTPAYCLEKTAGPSCFTFSILGNDCPLFNRPRPETDPTHIAEELNLPVPIRRRDFMLHKADYYGEGRSLQIWLGDLKHPVPLDKVVVADLSHWCYRPHKDYVAVDPVLGRIAFSPRYAPKNDVIVSYHYGFSAEIGGGEYERRLTQPEGSVFYYVGSGENYTSISGALDQWKRDMENSSDMEKSSALKNAVIEITDSGVYGPETDGEKNLHIELGESQSLQIRAASGVRPIIRLIDVYASRQDSMTINVIKGCRLTLDGLMITDHGISIEGDLDQVTIRHCTLVPGSAPLELVNMKGRVDIEHSIIGSISVNQDEVKSDPLPLQISDSIIDGIRPGRFALSAPMDQHAHAALTILRSTVLGRTLVNTIELAENCIFTDPVRVARSQMGCMRFCYIPHEAIRQENSAEDPDYDEPDFRHRHSRTPRRFCCQPDLAMDTDEKAFVKASMEGKPPETEIPKADVDAIRNEARNRVRPVFASELYGTPDYCWLDQSCPDEIVRGAEDESEMGAFHDLFQPQRAANLRARLEEYTVACMDAGIIYANYRVGGRHERRLFKRHI